jgi:hypothetical protein
MPKISRILRARYASELLIDPMQALFEMECAPGFVCGGQDHKDNPTSRGFLLHDGHVSWRPDDPIFFVQPFCPACGSSDVEPVHFDTRITN